jgi:hypothetical protein
MTIGDFLVRSRRYSVDSPPEQAVQVHGRDETIEPHHNARNIPKRGSQHFILHELGEQLFLAASFSSVRQTVVLP